MTGISEPTVLYDRVTQAWTHLLGDNFHYGLFTDSDESLASATDALTERLADLGRVDGQRTLDVGCGTGMPALWLAQERGCEVVGITLSQEGHAAAQARAAAHGLGDRLRFELRDGQDNGFPAASFDRVWVMESSHLMLRKDALMAECARVLRPGGRIVLCDIIQRGSLPLAAVLARAHDFGLLNRVFGQAKMVLLDDYARWAADAGMEVVHALDISNETRPTFVRWRENAQRSAHQVRELVGDRYLSDFRASCDVLDRFWEDGSFGYGIFVAQKMA